MATYNVQKSAGGLAVAIPDAASPDTQTDLHLVGQNAVSYGLDVAQSFYFLLENFANTSAPAVGGVDGQLWFDTTAGVLVLKVYDGTTWKTMAHTAVGAADSSMARWNDTSQEWEENTHLTLSTAGVMTLKDSTDADTITFTKVTSGALTIAATNTTDVTFSGLSGDLTVTGGRGLSVEDGGTAFAVRADAGGTAVNFTTASATDLNMPAGTTLNTIASATGRAGINIAEGVAPSAPNDGDVWVTAAGAFFARLNGVSTDLSAASGTVTSSGSPLADEVAVFTTGTNLDSDATFTWDGTTMFATNVTGTNIGGIVSASLISRTAPGTISGSPTFTDDVILSTANLTLADNDKIIFGTGSDVAVDFDSASGDFDIAATTAVDLNITGFTGSIKSNVPVHATSGGAESVRVIGDAATWATADSYVSFYDSDASEHGLQIGTIVADSSASRINARLGNLKLYASNTLAADISANTTTWTQNSITALVLRNAFLTGTDATTSATVADHNDQQHNVGYNETPPAEDDVGADINAGSFILDAVSIGKFISRTTSTSRTVTLNTGTGDIPIGGSVIVHNGSSSGTLTIVNGSITSLNWIDGSGSLPTATANRVLAYNSVVTLRKVSDTVWQIWGNGIS